MKRLLALLGFSFFIVLILSFSVASSTLAQNNVFTKNLARGASGPNVTALQRFLKTIPDVYPEGSITGYFGSLTEKAVKRFQIKYGLEPIGIVGPTTRKKLGELFSHTQNTNQSQGVPHHQIQIGQMVGSNKKNRQPSQNASLPKTVTQQPSIPTQPTNPLFGVPCKNDPKPVFIHDLTNPNLINYIQIYGLGEITPRFRSFLYINTAKTTKVPIYAPVDSDLVEATYKSVRGATDFDVHLMVSCQIWYMVNNITDPVDKIRQALPAIPVTNTIDIPKISPPIHFVAGELLGYTNGTPLPHNWDFGVFDLTHANQFVNQARYNQDKYGKIQTAICPFDFFPEAQKVVYYGLFGETKPVSGAKCGPISPDKAGTISGSWFEVPFTAPTGPERQRFKLMIGTYNDGVVRITGEDFTSRIEIDPTNPTYLEPLSVTTRHCYVADNQMVDFQVISDQQINVYIGTGSCGTVFPTSGFKNYYR